MTPRWHPSPNFGPRKGGLTPSIIVIHYTAMAGPKPALDRLSDPVFEVSAHYLVGQGGQLWQMVAEPDRAWHAGAGSWAGCDDVNSASVGIELCNRGDHPFPTAQIATLKTLVADIQGRWSIPDHRVIGHSDMAPGRKIDPGPLFPWDALLSLDVPGPALPDAVSASPDKDIFRRLLADFGYTSPCDDAALLTAMRLRFAPDRTGPLHEDDMATAAALAQIS